MISYYVEVQDTYLCTLLLPGHEGKDLLQQVRLIVMSHPFDIL